MYGFTLLRGVLCLVLLCSFSVLFSIVFTLLWEERAGLYASRVFVYFVCVTSCLFSFPLGVIGWLRLVTVALARLFS